jgi:hypothetical protein
MLFFFPTALKLDQARAEALSAVRFIRITIVKFAVEVRGEKRSPMVRNSFLVAKKIERKDRVH